MNRDSEIDYLQSKQAEDFDLLERARVRLGNLGLVLEQVELDRDSRPINSIFLKKCERCDD